MAARRGFAAPGRSGRRRLLRQSRAGYRAERQSGDASDSGGASSELGPYVEGEGLGIVAVCVEQGLAKSMRKGPKGEFQLKPTPTQTRAWGIAVEIFVKRRD